MLNTQTNEEWKDEIMTSKDDLPGMSRAEIIARWGEKGYDSIGRFGCVITSLSSVLNDFHKTSYFTPLWINTVLRDHKGYQFLKEKRNCNIGEESFIDWDVFSDFFDVKNIRNKIQPSEIEIKSPVKYYLARVPYSPERNIWSGHYNLIVNYHGGIITHFDSDTGVRRVDWGKSDLYWIKEIEFKKVSEKKYG